MSINTWMDKGVLVLIHNGILLSHKKDSVLKFESVLIRWIGFPCGSAGRQSACNTGGLGSIPELGRSPGERKGYPLQYSGLENFPWTVLSMGLQSVWHNWVIFTSLIRRMNLEPIIQSEVTQRDKYHNPYIWNLEKWYWIIYLQGSSGEIDIENRLMDMGRGEERMRYME